MRLLEIHNRCLTTTAEIPSCPMPNAILPMDVIRVLNEAKISFVLVGAYGLAGWSKEPRATKDVDVVVAARQVTEAVKTLLTAFPQLDPIDLPLVVRLREPQMQKVPIDAMKPIQQPCQEVSHHTHTVTSGSQEYRLPAFLICSDGGRNVLEMVCRVRRERS
jgi:hypothetical protein